MSWAMSSGAGCKQFETREMQCLCLSCAPEAVSAQLWGPGVLAVLWMRKRRHCVSVSVVLSQCQAVWELSLSPVTFWGIEGPHAVWIPYPLL